MCVGVNIGAAWARACINGNMMKVHSYLLPEILMYSANCSTFTPNELHSSGNLSPLTKFLLLEGHNSLCK